MSLKLHKGVCASITLADGVDDVIKADHGSMNDTPSIQALETQQTVAQGNYTHLVNERVNVKPQECGSKGINVFEEGGGQCADVSQTQHSTESDEEMDMTVLSQPMTDQLQIPPHLVLSFVNETYRQRNVIIIDHFPDLAPFTQAT